MPAVLIISPFCPEHATKGCSARLATMVEHLFSRGLEIDFLHVGRRREPVAATPVARNCLRSVHHVSLKHRTFGADIPKPIRDAARPSRSIVMRQFHRWSQKLQPVAPIERDIADVIGRTDPDLIWVDHTLLASIMPAADSGRNRAWIVDTHDVMHLRDESRRQSGLRADSDVSRSEEIRLLKRFDLVIAIQDAERSVFERMLPGHRVVSVGHAQAVRPLAARRSSLCFVGSRIDVNLQGITQFIERAWPAISARCPQARLEIVGTICRAPEVERLAAGDGRIVLRGTVAETDDIYDGPAVMICPLWAGSGLKIKMVEALSHGKATVTTPIGAQGLEEGAGQAFLVAETPDDFVEPAARLLDQAAERAQWETAAAIFARHHFSRQRVWQELDAELDRLLRKLALTAGPAIRSGRMAA